MMRKAKACLRLHLAWDFPEIFKMCRSRDQPYTTLNICCHRPTSVYNTPNLFTIDHVLFVWFKDWSEPTYFEI